MHGVLTWEHCDTADLRAAARKRLLTHYATVRFEDLGIETTEKIATEDGNSLFKAIDENDRDWWGRKVALAMREEDIIPEVEGYEECWVSGM